MTFRNYFIIICILLSLLGCGKDSYTAIPETPTLHGIVVESGTESLLVASMDDYELYYVSREDSVIYTTNDCLKITYNGEIGNNEVTAKSIGKIEYSLVSMYLQIIDELMLRNQGINSNAKTLSLNLKNCGLNEEEIKMIEDILKIRYGFQEIIYNSYDELFSQGLIKGEYPYFEDGLLIEIRQNVSDRDDIFTFDAMKYKGALAGYFMSDCVARHTKNGWIFEIGVEAIA